MNNSVRRWGRDSQRWLALLFVVLPVVAEFEELLFRGAQGLASIAVTALLGGVLGAAFVATGSLWAAVVAHYLVNALEFVLCEGFRG